MKEKYELEFLLKTSPRVLEKLINTPDGLSEWFADDVNINDDIYSFEWDGNEEEARLLQNGTTGFYLFAMVLSIVALLAWGLQGFFF